MKVYVITYNSWAGLSYDILQGVFSTRQLAQAWIEETSLGDIDVANFYIIEQELDKPE